MRHFLALSSIIPFLSCTAWAESFLQCTVDSSDEGVEVHVSIGTPHPEEMLLRRPDESYVYLQSADVPHKFPETDDFQNLRYFVIDSLSRGTEYGNDGNPRSAPILGDDGKYWLLIAENIETELENTLFFECSFEVGASDD